MASSRFIALASALLCGATTAHAALIINGDFEANGLAGWAANNSSVWANGSGHAAYVGGFSQEASIAQAFDTIAGTTYTVSFDYGGSSAYPGRSAISAGAFNDTGHLLAQEIVGTAQFSNDQAFWTDTFSFVATSARSTLGFSGTYASYTALLVDNISVNAVDAADATVPEPTTSALLAAALIALAASGRTRRASVKRCAAESSPAHR